MQIGINNMMMDKIFIMSDKDTQLEHEHTRNS